jgi:hypothetical protein
MNQVTMPPEGFDIVLMFPDEYSDFIAEIMYKGHYIGTVIQERGPGEFDIVLGPFLAIGHKPESPSLTLTLSDFEQAIEYAKKRLHDLRKSEA